MTWKNTIRKEFDRHGRDFDEQGLDSKGKPIPKIEPRIKDFIEEMENALKRYNVLWSRKDLDDREKRDAEPLIKKLKQMIEVCEDELKAVEESDKRENEPTDSEGYPY
jgi:Na+/phosphate symporter